MTWTRRLTVVALGLLLSGVAALGVLWAQGWRAYAVTSGSMAPVYRPGDLVLDRPATDGYRPGDVLTFQPTRGVRVTHRLTGIAADGLRTKGDANEDVDTWLLPAENVDGVVAGHVPRLGYVTVFLQQPAGIGGVVSTTVSLLLLHGLFFPGSPGAAGSAPAGPSARRRTLVVA